MTGKDMITGLSFIEERFIDEMEEEPPKKRQVSRMWLNAVKGLATAASLILITGAAVIIQQMVSREETSETLPEIQMLQSGESTAKPANIQGSDSENFLAAGGKIEEQQDEIYQQEAVLECEPESGITPGKMYLNEIESIEAATYSAFEQNVVSWDKEDIIQYYGKDLEPQYIPEYLDASEYNKKTGVAVNSKGEVGYDLVSYDYYKKGAKDTGLTESSETSLTRCGFRVAVSKIYEEPAYYINLASETERQISEIAGMEVIIGYRGMLYGGVTGEGTENMGQREMYTAQFEKDGCYYQIVAEGMSLSEVIKVIESIP